MLEGKAQVEDTDMPVMMQVQALSCAYQALDIYDVVDCTSIAAHIKKVLKRNPLKRNHMVHICYPLFSIVGYCPHIKG